MCDVDVYKVLNRKGCVVMKQKNESVYCVQKRIEVCAVMECTGVCLGVKCCM
jgi:hypothetical protein